MTKISYSSQARPSYDTFMPRCCVMKRAVVEISKLPNLLIDFVRNASGVPQGGQGGQGTTLVARESARSLTQPCQFSLQKPSALCRLRIFSVLYRRSHLCIISKQRGHLAVTLPFRCLRIHTRQKGPWPHFVIRGSLGDCRQMEHLQSSPSSPSPSSPAAFPLSILSPPRISRGSVS